MHIHKVCDFGQLCDDDGDLNTQYLRLTVFYSYLQLPHSLCSLIFITSILNHY